MGGLVLAATLLLFDIAATQTSEKGFEALQRGNYAAAVEIWKPIAEQGHKEAQYHLGFLYDRGEGVAENDNEATGEST